MRLVLVLIAALYAVSTEAAAPGWITSCRWDHALNDDPVVFPNQPGVSHLHDFAGSRDTDAASTPDSMEAAGTSCAMPADTSGYWTPRLFIHGGALSLRPRYGSAGKDALFYYRKKNSGQTATIPRGLKMIVGNSHARTPAENVELSQGRIVFKCGPGSGTDLPYPPASCSSGVMVVSFQFRSCWDGKNLDSPDHKSHMRYPPCPSTHPVPIPRIESFWRYTVGTNPIGTVEWAGENGERTPYFTAHSDFFNAWDEVGLQKLMDRCVNGGTDCGVNPTP